MTSCLEGGLKRDGFVNPTFHSPVDFDAELEPLISGPVESLVAGSSGFGTLPSANKSAQEGFTSKVFDAVEVGADTMFPVENFSIPDSITPLNAEVIKTGQLNASPGNSILVGNMPSALRMGSDSDIMGILNYDYKGASVLSHTGSDYQVNKVKCIPVSLKVVGLEHEANDGLKADLGFIPNPDENHVSIRSMDLDNEYVQAPQSSISKGKANKR